jgi:hypothetical protein
MIHVEDGAARHAETEAVSRERVQRYIELERLCEVSPPVAISRVA